MKNPLIVAILGIVAFAASVRGQQAPQRPMSPDGSAQVQVLGTWVKPERPTFALGREQYTGGKWIEITSGRPLQRQRDLFGSGASYGKAANDVGTATLPPPPVWRAGANVSTRLKSEVNLAFSGKTVPPGEYTVFIDLVKPTEWTLIISRWPAQVRFDPNNKDALWGAYNYTPDKDVVRVPMKVETLPFAVDQLTWTFLDMTPDSGRVAIMWGKTMASAPFKASAAQ
jgi:hypothetical protein